jgi:hypothetical protein|tara:strand:+ start:368 stop:745 length:378 start_codon:yes stop_codon:yes gene_type:complete
MSTIKANTLLHSDGSTTTQPSIPALDTRMAKAWVWYSGVSGVISNSYNVSSVTDVGTGHFATNFTTAMANVNYAFSYCGGEYNGSETTFQNGSAAPTTTSHRLQMKNAAGSVTDRTYVAGIFFGS